MVPYVYKHILYVHIYHVYIYTHICTQHYDHADYQLSSSGSLHSAMSSNDNESLFYIGSDLHTLWNFSLSSNMFKLSIMGEENLEISFGNIFD